MILTVRLRFHEGFYFEIQIKASPDLGWGNERSLRFVFSPEVRRIMVVGSYSEDIFFELRDPFTNVEFLEHLLWVTRSKKLVSKLAYKPYGYLYSKQGDIYSEDDIPF